MWRRHPRTQCPVRQLTRIAHDWLQQEIKACGGTDLQQRCMPLYKLSRCAVVQDGYNRLQRIMSASESSLLQFLSVFVIMKSDRTCRHFCTGVTWPAYIAINSPNRHLSPCSCSCLFNTHVFNQHFMKIAYYIHCLNLSACHQILYFYPSELYT